MCRTTLQRGFRLALRASGIKKAAHIHSLRHSYATCGLAGGAAAAGSNYCWTHSVDGVHTAKVGLNYKFDWGAPVIAKY